MNAPMPIDTDKIADNSTLQVMARLSMLLTPFLVAIVTWFAAQWFDEQARITMALRTDVNELSDELPTVKQRVAVVENNQSRSLRDREIFQNEMKAQFGEVQSLLRNLIESQAAMNATLAAQQRQIDQQLDRRQR